MLGTALELPAAGCSSHSRSGGLGQQGASMLEAGCPPARCRRGQGKGRRLLVPSKGLVSHPAALLQLPGKRCLWLFPAIAHPPWPSCGIPGWSSLVLGPVRSRDNWHPRDGVGALLNHHFTVLVFPWCCCAFAGSQLRAMTNLFSKQAQSKREVCANPRGGGGITARGWTGEARRRSSWECPAMEQPCRQQPPV